jgi:hypothetical protein
MNKMAKKAMLLIALATAFSFAQFAQEDVKIGIRAGFSLYDYSTGESEFDKKYVDIGYGFGAGLVVDASIASYLSFVPEINFLYRKPIIMSDDDREMWISEFAISIPVMLQLRPVEGVPFYLAFVGIQLDIPIVSKATQKRRGTEVTNDIKNRASIDFGIPLGIGYLITPNFGIDFRAVIGLTHPANESGSKDGWNQYGASLTYFFKH